MSLDALHRTAYTEDHEAFRQTVRRFMQEEIAPNAAKWQEEGIVPKSIWPKAGELGLLCPTVPEEYGGLGLDFGYNSIINEEFGYNTDVATGFSLQTDIVANYLIEYGSEEQKQKWLPKLASGEVIGTLDGFRFTADASARAGEQRLLLAAAERHLVRELARRAALLAAAADTEFRLDFTGPMPPRLLWNGFITALKQNRGRPAVPAAQAAAATRSRAQSRARRAAPTAPRWR